MEQFKAMVLEYSDCVKGMKQTRKRMAELKEDIMSYMKTHDHDVVDLPDGTKLVRKTAKTTEGLKKEHISSEVRKLVQSDAATDEVLNNMLGRREVGEKETLALVKRPRA